MVERLSTATESWRPQRRQSMFDPQVKRMALIAGGAAVVLALGVGGYALLANRPHGIPVIEADSRPIRVKPDNPGGMQVVGAEEQILGGAGGSQDSAMMAPAPETPEPQVLRAQIQAARQPAPAPAPTPVAPPVLSAAAPSTPPVTAPAPSQPAPAAVAAKTPPSRPAATPASGGMEVQLAALETEQAAMTEWQKLAKRMPELMASHHPAVVRAERDGKVFYRLRTGGFSDTAQATAFCTEVKAKGGGCAIASF